MHTAVLMSIGFLMIAAVIASGVVLYIQAAKLEKEIKAEQEDLLAAEEAENYTAEKEDTDPEDEDETDSDESVGNDDEELTDET